MSSISILVATYILGGFTLIPLILALGFVYSIVILPKDSRFRRGSLKEDLLVEGETREDSSELKSRLEDGNREADMAASYFAVCREYVPGGINGKPPERTTPAGEVIAAESPSVYQSMYRSIFDRHKTQSPSIETGKLLKRARNVFYIVLRHGHLMLFDDSDQLEVRHVIALAHYDVDIYGGDAKVLEGELYIKRNSIRLSKKRFSENASVNAAPLYLFSENCSEKEDFYHALLYSQKRTDESSSELPRTQDFETEDMIKLIRLLHLSEENLQSRWLNGLIGRLFLALYKTPEIENFIRNKIKKKIARVQKPTFITSLNLEDVSMGESAPMFNNLKLKDMNLDGAVTLEADVKYTGKMRAVISAVAKIELGQHFKPREVDLVLAGVLERLEGHLLIRIKPPPSNRVWVSFETMPKLEFTIEPIVSSRQITYGLIIRAIESRIREVFGETLVFPNWDDIPFTNTESQTYRGGIWKADASKDLSTGVDVARTQRKPEINSEVLLSQPLDTQGHLPSRKQLKHLQADPVTTPTTSEPPLESSDQAVSQLEAPPMSIRSNSFTSTAVASPAVVTKVPVASDKAKRQNNSRRQDAATAMKSLSSRTHESSSLSSPTRQPHTLMPQMASKTSQQSASVCESTPETSPTDFSQPANATSNEVSRGLTPGIATPVIDTIDDPKVNFISATSERKIFLNQTIASATATAKKWGFGVMQRAKDLDDIKHARRQSGAGPLLEPLGRGMPLPPPGEPLPRPESKSWAAGSFGSFKRKPVAGAFSKSSPSQSDLFTSYADTDLDERPLATAIPRSETSVLDKDETRSAIQGILQGEPIPSASSTSTEDLEESKISETLTPTELQRKEVTESLYLKGKEVKGEAYVHADNQQSL